MYRCETLTIKKARVLKNWCFRTVVLKILRVPWTARRSNQSPLKEISPKYSLKGLMLKLKLQYFGYLMRRTDSWKRPWCWERFKSGREGDDRGWDGWMASSTQWTWVWASSGCWWMNRKAWHVAVHGVAKSWTWLSNWTDWITRLDLYFQDIILATVWKMNWRDKTEGRETG